MINKFLILFFTIFSHVFPGIVITDKNNHCRFDVRNVEYIGLIKIDSSFADYVLHRNCFSWLCPESIFFGKELQNELLDYIKACVNLELNDEDVQYINDLIHKQEIDKPEDIMIVSDIINVFSNRSEL